MPLLGNAFYLVFIQRTEQDVPLLAAALGGAHNSPFFKLIEQARCARITDP